MTKSFCTLDKDGAPVLKALPTGEPTLLRCHPSDWNKLAAFTESLEKAATYTSWRPSATDACRSFLAAPPCALRGVAWDLDGLCSPVLAAPPAAHVGLGERELAVCPLITRTRTAADYARDVATVVGVRDPARFNVAFAGLELGDFAFVLARTGSPNAFTLQVSGKLSRRVELLEIAALNPQRKVCTASPAASFVAPAPTVRVSTPSGCATHSPASPAAGYLEVLEGEGALAWPLYL